MLHSTRENAMRRVFIMAIMLLGITTAQGQTVLQMNGQTNSSAGRANSSESAVGSDPLNVPTSSVPSVSSPSLSSQSGTASGSPATTGSAGGGAGAASSASGTVRLRLDEFSIAFAITGRNTGHIHTGGKHERDRSWFSLADLSASGPIDRRGLGKPERDGRRVARWMLRLENNSCADSADHRICIHGSYFFNSPRASFASSRQVSNST